MLFLTFSVLIANPEKVLYMVVNPARGLLNRKREQNKKSGSKQNSGSPAHDIRREILTTSRICIVPQSAFNCLQVYAFLRQKYDMFRDKITLQTILNKLLQTWCAV